MKNDSNLCELGNCFKETKEHLFLKCQITQKLLSNLNMFLANNNTTPLIRNEIFCLDFFLKVDIHACINT